MGRFAFVTASVVVGGCTLFTDLGGLDGPAPTTVDAGPDVRANDDATVGTDSATIDDGGPTEDAQPSAGKYARTLTVTNVSTEMVPAGNSVCTTLAMEAAGASVSAMKMRADFNDLRVHGPSGKEVARTVDALPQGRAYLCFRLEQAIAASSGATYEMRYGDPNATPGPVADVFSFVENFDTAPTGPKWATRGSPTVTNGRLKLPAGTVSSIATPPATDGVPIVASLVVAAQITNPTSPAIPKDAGNAEDYFLWWLGFQRYGDFAEGEPWMLFIERDVGSVKGENKQQTSGAGPCSTTCAGSAVGLDDKMHVYRIDRYLGGVVFTHDEGAVFSASGSSGDMAILIRNSLLTSDMIIDWVRARPIVWPEPTIAVSAEKTL